MQNPYPNVTHVLVSIQSRSLAREPYPRRLVLLSCIGTVYGRHIQPEPVEKLVKCLDPNDLGRINFKDFCRGVFAMKGCEELLKDVLSVESAGTLPCSPEIPDCVEQGRPAIWAPPWDFDLDMDVSLSIGV
ncbi:rab11 family-interacting protein 4 [Cricetulus griseus]|nr:rab11 family-interacting protein 4 [Cricetulus griseus]